MLYRAPRHFSQISPLKIFCLIVVVCAGAFVASIVTPRVSSQAAGELRFELPANGNLRVENLRGGVIAEVWNENYVSVAAVGGEQATKLPAVVERGEGLLSIRLARGAANAARIDLQLKIPARAHLAIVTSDGSVVVQGLPAALLTQSGSGEIRVELPNNARASVVADSKTGSVSSSIDSLAVNRGASPQLQSRVGGGGSSVRLYSQAGNITVANSASASSRVVTPAESRTETISPSVTAPTPRQRPELIGPEQTATPAGTPAPANTGPVEVDEGDVIRVDTELVSVNVSVVDRGTNRGVNDLTKDDFRLFEDNAPQQIAHFDSASAPFNLLLLIDLSGSTTKVVDTIKAAALHFVNAARPFDRIAVITFAGSQVVVSPLTTDHEALRQRISAIQKPEGSTKLYDSIAFAMDEVFREAKDTRRNAIVVISDGLDSVLPNVSGEGSTLTHDEVIRRAKEFDGVVYSIWTDTQSYEPLSPLDIQQETFDLAHDRMKDLAEAGGGAFYECEKLEDLSGAYDRVVADLGTLYTLSYRPTNKIRDGSWRTIRVNVNRPNTVARGKRGYFAK